MSALSVTDILSLKVGDLIEAPSFMSVLTKEPMLLSVTKVSLDSTEFRALFHGVRLFTATFSHKKGEAKWTFN